MKKLFIISNESIFKIKEEFYCDNLDMKSLPDGLNNSFKVTIIARKSRKIRSHKITLNNINILTRIRVNISYILAGLYNHYIRSLLLSRK